MSRRQASILAKLLLLLPMGVLFLSAGRPRVFVALWVPLAVVFCVLMDRVTIERIRKREGRCLSCGYSLTGNTSGVCPECGTPATQQLPAKSN